MGWEFRIESSWNAVWTASDYAPLSVMGNKYLLILNVRQTATKCSILRIVSTLNIPMPVPLLTWVEVVNR